MPTRSSRKPTKSADTTSTDQFRLMLDPKKQTLALIGLGEAQLRNFYRLALIRPTTTTEAKLMKPFSNSRLEDMSHCPTWGVVHMQKQYATKGRAMALEAGEAMHQVFAAIRCWQLGKTQKLPKHAQIAAERVFGKQRWRDLNKNVNRKADETDQLRQLAINTLHTSGFYDDPSDTTRTIANMELAALHYIDERIPYFENWPVWVADRKNPNAPIGIEQVFDVVLQYSDGYKIRFIGTIDGIAVDVRRSQRVTLEENKTAARLDDAWKLAFDMKHQPTGYMAAGMALFGVEMLFGRVFGLKIKPTHRGEDFAALPVRRKVDDILNWGHWVRYNENVFQTYATDYEHAPRFTHSCNRFFRPCALIPFCADTPAGRKADFSNMVDAEPSPSERAIAEATM